MPLTKARILVRGLDVRAADQEGDAAWLARLGLFAARRWTPRAAVSGPDGLWLDLTGVAHLFGGEEAMCARILAFCRRLGFTARIAVAGTAGAAHALGPASAAAADPLSRERGEADALAPMPLAALRLDDDAAVRRRAGSASSGSANCSPCRARRSSAASARPCSRGSTRRWAARPNRSIRSSRKSRPPVLLRFLEPIASAEAIEEASGEAVRRLVPLLAEAGLGVRHLAPALRARRQ